MSDQLYRGALTPDHRSDWLSGRPPAPVWTSALSCPSSGNARLLPVYAGALSATTSKLVYRKAKAGEHSYAKGTRWETLTGAAYVDQDTINISGSNVTAVGNATHLGLSCNYITWPATTHDFASSYCWDTHGTSVAVGQVTGARVSIALSRALAGETISLRVTGSSGSSTREITALPVGQFVDVVLADISSAHIVAGAVSIWMWIEGTLATPLSIYIRRRMLFDATGLDASECVPDFVDPAVDYGFGAVGVKWVPTKCGNTVAANGVIVPGTGAALPEPMGVQWQPAATGLTADSPPSANGQELSNAAAPTAVAGLPARRITATAVDTYHYFVSQSLGVINGAYVVQVLARKPATGDGRPRINVVGGGNPTVTPSADWSTLEDKYNAPNSTITPLGNECYLIELKTSAVTADGTIFVELILNKGMSSSYADAAVFLDIAAFNAVAQAYAGTPMLASAGATARLADDPATGLPAIGTGPFTAFVEFTVSESLLSGFYPALFLTSEGGLTPCSIYLYSSGPTILAAHGGSDLGSGPLTVGVRQRAVLRRDSIGLVTLFTNGALRVSRADALSSLGVPKFGSSTTNFTGDVVTHDQWLEYSALSDEDCIRVTRI